MKTQEIGIVILATNAYLVLGLRFVRRFSHFYKGNKNIKFYFFSDTDPKPFLPVEVDFAYMFLPEEEGSSATINLEFHHAQHTSWVDGTNSKFSNILKLKDCSSDYLYYFDADTNIQKDFTDEWFLGDIVGGEHYSNRTTLKDGAGFDRNPKGNSYVPLDSKLPYTYFYGAFFGGLKKNVIEMMTILRAWQKQDQKVGYEPPVNDESYINKYFHFNRPKVVPIEEFGFVVSDKGGVGNTRQMNLNLETHKTNIKLNRGLLWDIQHNNLIIEDDRL